MRIISGQFRSRRLIPPSEKAATRPITDRVKESVFNHLREQFEGTNVIDLFCGTGSLGLEALSLGAGHVLFVERTRETGRRLKQNLEGLGIEPAQYDIVTGDALSPVWLRQVREPVQVVFFDPPYALMSNERTAAGVMTQMDRLAGSVSADGFVLLRTAWPMDEGTVAVSLESPTGALVGPETVTYKTMAVHFYQPASSPDSQPSSG
ncbi:MAG: 16S rRNA (guanine(966)-N(2))-methyltransferase RsmD [Planctomycetes bacterium]|nr:16S rRNA (guanine(966)-N(2))-methyltransferase RsmD [Planctomycetota bacterium]NOG53554.1 16S rRNA (guanine(966)-N(2))-methyltransferase RsmD [Planctomycetota bacterium]